MKTIPLVLAFVWFAVNTSPAQGAGPNATWHYVNAVTNLTSGSNAAPSSPVATEKAVILEPPVVYVTNGPTVIDLGIGATRIVRPEIRLLDDGAVADYGLQKVFFPAEITEAPITIITPDGRELSCRATFLAVYDAASGQSLVLGGVRKCIGELVGGDTVVYPDAFDTIRAGIRYRYTPYRLEQDILIYDQFQLPKEFQSTNVQLEVWTEWIDSTPDSKVSQTIDLRPLTATGAQLAVVATDETVKFGAMRIADGYAFGIQDAGEKTPVAKTFTRIEGRDWLIESADYTALKPKLDKLPKSQASLAPNTLKSDRRQLVRSMLARSEPKSSGKPMRMAKAKSAVKDSVVLDFVIVSGVPVPSGAVSWWPGGGNALDAIGTNNGTLQGNVGYTAGKVGQGFNLDGNQDGVAVGNSTNLQLQDFSIEAWVRRASTSLVSYGSYGNGILFGYGYLGYGLYLDPTGKPALSKIGISGVVATAAITNTSYHHVAVTKTGTTVVFYVDGVADPVGAYNPGFSFATSAAIGFRADNLDNSFYGAIDEPAVYNRALSAAEVQSIYNAGAAGKNNPKCVTPPANIAGWWPGDDNAYDLARTNFGALVGDTTYVPAVVGQGFYFDGTGDGVTIPDNAGLNVGASDNFSLEGWVQALTNSGTTYGVTSIVDKRVAPNVSQCLGYVFCLVNGKMNLRISDSIAGIGANFSDTQDLRIGSGYHHIAVTVNRGSTNGGHFYVDGVQRPVVFDPTVVSGSLSCTGAFLIGIHAQPGFNGGHKGVIDEVSFYRRELTNTEIAALYSAGGAGKCKGDTDGDGLTDLQEAFLGTNPNLADTDGDGLTDGDEVFIYRTNPNSQDSDGDGVIDQPFKVLITRPSSLVSIP